MRERNQLREACLDLLYLLFKRIGVIWIGKRLPYMQMRPWVKEREERK
jgi:hypothetical protein